MCDATKGSERQRPLPGVRLTGAKVNDLCNWTNNFPSAYSGAHWSS
jgi:hypothetical protein